MYLETYSLVRQIFAPNRGKKKTRVHSPKKIAHTGPRELDGHPLGGCGSGFWFSSWLYHPFGKGPGRHQFGSIKIKSVRTRTKRIGICPHTQKRWSPHYKAFPSKIHALNVICPPKPIVKWRVFNFLLHDHTNYIYPRTHRHMPPHPKAFVSTAQGIYLENSRNQRHLPAKTPRGCK